KDIFFAKARNYPSALVASLDPDNVPQSVYDSLIAAVRQALPDMHRLVRLKKEILGVDEMHMYDLYVPMATQVDMKIPYGKACDIVCEGLAPLGAQYIDTMRRGIREGGWADVYENQGKTSGAYSWGVWGTHPYVLLNWNDTLDNLLTLAHELGHAMHSHLSDTAQPYAKSQYPLLLAEVASTCNEAILMDYMLGRTQDADGRRYLLGYFLEQFRTTMFRQVMFAEFEKIIHARVEEGEALTPETLRDIYRGLNVDYYGPDMVVDEAVDMEWARIPHFYRSFYVYKYATGFASAIYLSRMVLKGGDAERERYISFLRGGGSDYPLHLLRRAGVDLTQPETVSDALRTFAATIDEMEELV
ncbi:MAG: oligoendopeptidase F family protein, partial [Clostridiales bacterium]|nr:oligoendopeptidase F family protein [Clostridiales bacterium]